MASQRSFTVFGEPVEVLVTGDMTGGASATLTHLSPPGGGVPPHLHQNEDETFFVLEGEYEFLVNGEWVRRSSGDTLHAVRGSLHGFRNAGSTDGKLLVFVAPAGLENFLEEISTVSMPQEAPRLVAVADRYGISFAPPPNA